MRRWGWWGLAGLGLLAVMAGIWTLVAPETGPSGRRRSPAEPGCGARTCLAADSAAGAGFSAEGALATALSVSVLDSGGVALAATGAPGSSGPGRALPSLGAGMHLSRAGGRPRAVPEAPGLVFLGLAVVAGVARRRTGSRTPGARVPSQPGAVGPT